MSEEFLSLISQRYANYTIEDTIIWVGEGKYWRVPRSLPFGKVIPYSSDQDTVQYRLYLRKLNLTDIECVFQVIHEGKITAEIADSVIYQLYSGESMTNAYGFRYNMKRYIRQKNQAITDIGISRNNGLYANYSFRNYRKGQERKSYENVIFKRDDINEPYHHFLSESLRELSMSFDKWKGNKSDGDLKIYQERFNYIKVLLRDIARDSKETAVYKDTALLDLALASGNDSLILLLRQYGYVARPVKSVIGEHIASADDLTRIRGMLFINFMGDVRSKDFEELTFGDKMPDHQRIFGYKEYSVKPYLQDPVEYRDKTLVILADNGFENISFVITAWERSGKNYILRGILDKLIYSPIGGMKIDTLMRIDEDRHFIIGTTSGGDAGDMWGSLWFGVWQEPDGLRIVYSKAWADVYEGEHSSLDYNFIGKKKIRVVKKEYQYDSEGRFRQVTDSTLHVSEINLDTLVNKKHIDRYSL